MKVTKKILPASKIQLEIEIEPAEMEKYFDQAVKKVAHEVDIPGFRPGKAPRKVLESKIGKNRIFEEAANIALTKSYAEAVVKEKISVVGEPEVKIKKVALGESFNYEAFLTVLPEFKLPEIEKIKVKRQKVAVSEKDIAASLKQLQKSRAKIKAVDREARSGDQVEIDFKTYLGKVPVENGESKNHPLTLGESNFVPGFEEKLSGLKKAAKTEFTLKFPKDYHQKHLAAKDVRFEVTMKEVRKKELPALDDAFAKSLGEFKDLADLKKKVSENLKLEKEQKEEERLETEILKALLAQTNFFVPEALVKNEQQKMLDETRHMIESQGGKLEQYLEGLKKTKEQILEGFKSKAEERVKVALILREIGLQKEIKVSKEELEKEIAEQVTRYQYSPEIAARLQTAEYRDYYRGILRNRKVNEYLKEKMVRKS